MEAERKGRETAVAERDAAVNDVERVREEGRRGMAERDELVMMREEQVKEMREEVRRLLFGITVQLVKTVPNSPRRSGG